MKSHLPHGACLAVLLTAAGPAAQSAFDPLPGGHLPFVPTGAVRPLLADFDGDGRSDLFLGGSLRRYFRRSGPGRFADVSERLPTRGGSLDRAAVALDQDQDGDLDLVIASDGGIDVLLRNDGAAGFTDLSARQPWASLSPQPRTRSVALGDVDGDGVDDLVFGDVEPDDRLYLGRAGGGFTDCAGCQPAPLPGTFRVLLEDFDLDGDLDLLRLADSAPAGSATVGVFETNDGRGNWTVVADGFQIRGVNLDGAISVDVDVDGDPDLVVWGSGGSAAVIHNDAASGLRGFRPILASGPGVQAVTAADRDGDGASDLLVASTTGTRLLRNDGSGRFAPFSGVTLPESYGVSLYAEWFEADDDGDLDILLDTGQLELRFREGGGFVAATAAELPPIGGPVAVGDLNGDGIPDVFRGARFDPYPLGFALCNDGDGRFTYAEPLPTLFATSPASLHALATGDVDVDGHLDVVVAEPGQAAILVLGLGNCRFARGVLPRVRTSHTAAALADVDADGDLDLALAGESVPGFQRAVSLLLNDGQGAFTDASVGRVPDLGGEVVDVAFADLDGDGAVDLLLGIPEAGGGSRLLTWRNEAVGHYAPFPSQPPAAPGSDPALGVADFDADGDVDVAMGGALLANDGRGAFTDVTATRTDAPPGAAPAFVDVDADGDLDLLTVPIAFRQEADGRFRRDDSLFGGPAPRVHGHADVDGDDDVDLVTAAGLWRNLQREILVPLQPRLGGVLRTAVYGERNQVAFVAIGVERAATPVRVPPTGIFKLDPAAIVAGRLASIPAQGAGEVSVSVPPDAGLAGVEIHVQAVLLGATFADWRFTRAETATLLR